MYIEEEIYLDNQEKRSLIANFLNKFQLQFDNDIDYSIVVYDNERIIATASKSRNILKCFAILDSYQGMGITNSLVKKIEDRMFQEGLYHFFIVTPRYNKMFFTNIGYKAIITSSEVTILENGNRQIKSFLTSLKTKHQVDEKEKACIIINGNPFSLGHQFLIEKAAALNDAVLVFVVTEDKSSFPFSLRLHLVKEGTKHLKNVTVLETGPYLVSQITFPTYFLKDSSDVVKIQTKMDTEIFATYYKPVFNITRRYVGTEPYCEVTKAYNEMMKLVLPKYGIEVIEVERKAINGQVISASSIRELLKKRNFQALKRLVPQTTYDYLTNPEIIDKLRENQGRH